MVGKNGIFRQRKKGGSVASFLSVRGFTVLMTVISGLRTMISGLMSGVFYLIEDGFCALFRVLSKCGKSRHHSLVLNNGFFV